MLILVKYKLISPLNKPKQTPTKYNNYYLKGSLTNNSTENRNIISFTHRYLHHQLVLFSQEDNHPFPVTIPRILQEILRISKMKDNDEFA